MRRTLAAAVSTATLVLAAACGSTPETVPTGPAATEATATTAPATPDDSVDPSVLTASAVKAMSGSVRMTATVTAGPETIVMSGDIDALRSRMTLNMTMSGQDMELRRSGSDMYLRTGGTANWIHIDVRKLSKTGPMYEALNPLANLGALGGVTSARQVGSGRYEGFVDMAKAISNSNPLAEKLATEQLKKYASVATAMPFEATIDEQGRLTSFTFTMTVPQGEVVAEMTMSRFGQEVVVAKPPANQTVEAPASAYKDL